MLWKHAIGLIALACCVAAAPERYVPERDPQPVAGLPYVRYTTRDAFDRQITFYIANRAAGRVPLIVFVLGSGAHSQFSSQGSTIVDPHGVLRDVIGERAALLVVEKPGVRFLEQPKYAGTALGASEEFRRENTLDRWAEAVTAAIRAARTLPFVDTSRTLLMGHSEGARVVSRIAAANDFVSHVAVLAGGGAPQLFSLMAQARAGRIFGNESPVPDTRVTFLLRTWMDIQAHPDDIDRYFLGHPFRYWVSYGKSAPGPELLRSKARVYLAHGTEDTSSPIVAFDVLYSELVANGADIIAERIPGADHVFLFPAEPQRDGRRELFQRILNWFFIPQTPHVSPGNQGF